jgi:hypothetical protein
MQQKVQFISAVLHDPDLVVLDEPFSALDPVNRQVLFDTVIDYRRRGKTVLFSTHIMEHAEKLCDRLCIIARGKKLIDGTLTDVKRTHGGKHVVIAFDGSQGGAQQIFADRRLVAGIHDFGQQAELELADGADAQEILRALVNSGARLSRFELASRRCKIFVDLVGPEATIAGRICGLGRHSREFVERCTKWFWISAIWARAVRRHHRVPDHAVSRRRGTPYRGRGQYDLRPRPRVVEGLGASKLIRAVRVVAGGVIDSLTSLVETKQLNGFLILSTALAETGQAEYRASSLSFQTIEELQRALNRLIVKVRLEQRGVNPAVVNWAQSVRVTLDQKKIARGRTRAESAGESFVVAWVMSILLFAAILLYGVNVMTAVLEEKTARIVEVLVSSLRPFQLMLGKVAGAGTVSFFNSSSGGSRAC